MSARDRITTWVRTRKSATSTPIPQWYASGKAMDNRPASRTATRRSADQDSDDDPAESNVWRPRALKVG